MSNQTQMTIENLSEKYHQSSLLDRNIVRLLALNFYAMRQKDILKALLKISRESAKIKTLISPDMIRKSIKDLIKSGLVLKSAAGYSCNSNLRPTVIINLIEHKRLAKTGAALQEIHPAFHESRYPKVSKTIYYRSVRDLGLAIFKKDNLEKSFDIFNSIYLPEDYDHPLEIIFNQPFSPELLQILDQRTVLFYLSHLLISLEYSLIPAPHIINYIFANHPDKFPYPTLLARGLTEHGLFDRALQIASATKPEDHNFHRALALRARIALLRGDNEFAVKTYKESFRLARKARGQRKKTLPDDYDSIYFMFALLQSDDNQLFLEAITYLHETTKVKRTRLHHIFCSLLQIFNDLSGQKNDFFLDLFLHPQEHFTRSEQLLHFIIIGWIRPDFLNNFTDSLIKLQQETKNGGYDWMTAETSLLLAKLNHKPEANRKLGAELHRKCRTSSLVNIITPLAQWEKVLRSLNTITKTAASGTKQPGQSEQRLIWYFDYNQNHQTASLYPRIQKMTKAGNWSKGRAAALSTLYAKSGEMSFLTPADKTAISAIRQYDRGYYYHSTELAFDMSLALPALIGHPLIFLSSNPAAQIELVAGKVELSIEKQADNEIVFHLEPCPLDSENKLLVIAETPTRYQIIKITPQIESIRKIIGSGVTLPPEAETRVRETAVSLSGLITVQSDITSDQDIKEITADPRPHLHLLPFNDGLSVSFRVKPFGRAGSSFKPGIGGRSVITEIKQEKIQARRDLDKERLLSKKIIKSCPSLQFPGESEHEWIIPEPQAALELLLELKALPDKTLFLEWPQGEKFKVKKELPRNSFSLKIEREQEWFKASGNLEIDQNLCLNLQELLAAINKAQGRFIPLDDNTFITITNKLRQRLQELAAYSEESGTGLRFNPLARLAMGKLEEEVGNFSGDKSWREQGQRLQEIITPKIPSTFQARLRDYQVEGFNWLAQLSHWQIGACLADDMGLGKTLQALAVILTRAAQGPTLVVAPLSVINNWEEECHRFAPTLKPALFGPGDRQQMLNESGPFDLIISSYGLLNIESEKLQTVSWQTVVLDEAQAIKNMQTKRSQAAMQLKAEFRLITTGTPIENHLGELWTLYNFLNPGLLGGYKWFQNKFAIPIEKQRDPESNSNLKKLIQPFILRRLKSEVLQELPAKTEITLKVEMSPEEATLYEAQRQRALANLASNASDLPGHLQILVEIMKLRRLCCNPRLLLPESDLTGSKLKVFADTVKELLANRHKALVFSQFVDHLALIKEYLDQEKITYQYLDGSTPAKQRKIRINDFQNGNGDLFLISLKAGGSGLNLTAADYVIHMDPWWNPAVEDQASDRAHRIGQKRPVTVYRIIIKDSIEEQIVDLHKHKRDLADNLLAGSDISGKLNAAELLQMLQQ